MPLYDFQRDRVRVRNSGALSKNSGSYGSITFDTEDYDSNNLHSTATVPISSRLTVVKAGTYRIFTTVEWATNGTGYRLVQIVLNGVTVLCSDTMTAVTGQVSGQSLETDYQLNVNDYVEVDVLQNSGGALNVNSSGVYSPVFGMSQVA